MKLTKLKRHSGTIWAAEVDHSGKLVFLHAGVVNWLDLKEGMELTPEEWENAQHMELSRKAYQYACYLLDNRGYSYQGLYQKLEPKYPEDVCYKVMDRLLSRGQINDWAYAEQLAHHYVERKQFGYYRARQEMYQKGLLERQIETALSPYAEQIEENLRTLIQGKYSKFFEDPDERRQLERGKAALLRRGYTFSQINQAVEELWEEET